MIKDETNDDAPVRRFLLGEMADEERAAFEESFILDENLYDRVRVVEDDMIEAYVCSKLSPADVKKFEQNFLQTDRRRERIAFARAMLTKVAETRNTAAVKKTGPEVSEISARSWLSGLVKFPNLAFAGGIALLAIIIGGWLILRDPGSGEVAKEGSLTPKPPIRADVEETPISAPGANEKVPSANEVNAKASNKVTGTSTDPLAQNANTRVRTASSPVLALFSGVVRSGGTMPEITLPADAPGLNLRLKLESQDHKSYEVEIVDPNGSVVFRSHNLGAKNSILNLFVPSSSVRRDDYIVKVSGAKTKSEPESVADFSFRVKRK